MCDFDENLEKFEFWAWYIEKYAGKCKNKNSCQNWVCDLHFVFWNLGLCQVFLYFFCISVFSRILKNWVEDAITFRINKKRHHFYVWLLGIFIVNGCFVSYLLYHIYGSQNACHFGIYSPFPFTWDSAWPYWKQGKRLPQWQVNLVYMLIFDAENLAKI